MKPTPGTQLSGEVSYFFVRTSIGPPIDKPKGVKLGIIRGL